MTNPYHQPPRESRTRLIRTVCTLVLLAAAVLLYQSLRPPEWVVSADFYRYTLNDDPAPTGSVTLLCTPDDSALVFSLKTLPELSALPPHQDATQTLHWSIAPLTEAPRTIELHPLLDLPDAWSLPQGLPFAVDLFNEYVALMRAADNPRPARLAVWLPGADPTSKPIVYDLNKMQTPKALRALVRHCLRHQNRS